MIIVFGTARFPAQNVEKVLPAIETLIAAVRQEDGCIQYRFAEDLLDKGLIHISELWRDAEALAAHGRQPHMLPWRDAAMTFGLHDMNLSVFDAANQRPL